MKDETPKPYSFEYGVEDHYTGTKFSQQESSDAKTVTGGYSVQLPDGRTQHVHYTADPYGYGGFVADVKYDGYAQFPKHQPSTYHPEPVYKPAPVIHKPAPVVYKPTPIIHKTAPVYHPAPIVHKPVPVYKPAPITYHS